jgi:hypothetical protein
VKPWFGTGWYVYSGFECNGQSHAPAIDWGDADSPLNFTNHVNDLARRGFTQLMIYDLETIVCNDYSRLETALLPVMDLMADVGMRVMVSVKQWMQQSADHRTGGPSSETYSALKNVTDLLKNHKALLGWYVCDDCCPGGDREGDEDMLNYTASYAILKGLDPCHYERAIMSFILTLFSSTTCPLYMRDPMGTKNDRAGWHYGPSYGRRYHPAFGAVQCPRAWEFLDGPGGRG